MIYGAVLLAGGLGLVVALSHDVLRQLAVRLAWKVSAPFAVGDTVRVGELSGTVAALRWTHICLHDDDGDELLVPNTQVLRSAVARVRRDRGSQPVEVLVPIPSGIRPGPACQAALEAARVSPYLAIGRPIRVAAIHDASGRVAVRVHAGVFDGRKRDAFSNSVIAGLHEYLGDCAAGETG